jgi:UDP-GlcNAc:undecaprenyl-phosphate/decaprenyl-phosphate GlcNAc-1-phosphate transferase
LQNWTSLLTSFALALVLSLLLISLVKVYAVKAGKVTQPRQDRWHRKPTPYLGGVALYLAFMLAVFSGKWLSGDLSLMDSTTHLLWSLLAGSSLMFAIGLWDDLKPLSPQVKLAGQISAAALLVAFGGVIDFFPWDFANLMLTFIWLVGITNAINLLDNMDGLAGGIALIATGFLAYFFWIGGNLPLLMMALTLIGCLLGFLVFNFPPARIFMGDSGSLFLGFTLAALAVVQRPRASDVFSVMAVPTLLLLLPIFDTLLVTVTRTLRGQSPLQGGADHISHRLVIFGLSERQTVLGLYAVGLFSGVTAAVLEVLDYDLSLVLIPFLLISLSLGTAYLSRLKVVSTISSSPTPITRFIHDLAYQRRIFEIFLDFLVIGLALYLAFWTYHGFQVEAHQMQVFLLSLPAVLPAAYLSFFTLGVYRGLWQYLGIKDLGRFFQASLLGVVLAGLTLTIFQPNARLPLVIFFLYGLFLFFGLAASRFSFRLLDQTHKQRQPQAETQRVLIYGVNESGEMALRWILNHPEAGYLAIGILDEDPHTWQHDIHGVRVLGGSQQIDEILAQHRVQGVILANPTVLNDPPGNELRRACRANGVWLKVMHLDFQELI